MARKTRPTARQPQAPARPRPAAGRPYSKPTLVKRERLAQVSADSKISATTISDRRLKQDIRRVGRTFDGLGIYVFRYVGEPTFQMGVMAQEVLAVRPEAVGERNGYFVVDYARIGGPARRPYARPSLARRERLSQVSADSKVSGITTDSSDRRLKADLRLVGHTDDGINVYVFRYRNEAVHRMGVIAQEVRKRRPDAVGERDGYLTVDYSRIGKPATH